jgi:hypothetical protein
MRKDITVESIMQQARMDEANAAYMRSQASNALLSGDIAMLGNAFAGAAGAFKGMGGGGGTGMGPGQSIGGGPTPFFSPFGGT